MNVLTRSILAAALAGAAAVASAATSNPLLVTVVSNAVPYTKTYTIHFVQGYNRADVTFSDSIPQRIYIQTVTLYHATGLPVGSAMHGFVFSTTGGAFNTVGIPSAISDGSPYPTSATALSFSQDPNTAVEFNLFRSDTSTTEDATVVLTGYTVPGN